MAGTSVTESQTIATRIRFCEKGVMRKEDEELLARVATEKPELLESKADATALDSLLGRLIEAPPEPKRKRGERGITKSRGRQK
jgi:hypothetical protein